MDFYSNIWKQIKVTMDGPVIPRDRDFEGSRPAG